MPTAVAYKMQFACPMQALTANLCNMPGRKGKRAGGKGSEGRTLSSYPFVHTAQAYREMSLGLCSSSLQLANSIKINIKCSRTGASEQSADCRRPGTKM